MGRKNNDIDFPKLIHLSIDQYKEQAIDLTGIDRNQSAATALIDREINFITGEIFSPQTHKRTRK